MSQSISSSSSALKWFVIAAWLSSVTGYFLWSRSQGLTPIEAAQELRNLFIDNWWGIPLFILVYVLRPVILFPASVLTILAGLAYGLTWGVVLVVIASNLSTAASYVVGRYFASSTFIDRLPRKIQSTITSAIDRPFETTLIMRLLALPFDAVGYVAGFARLRFTPFIVGSALGTILGTIAFVGFGASIESLQDGTPTVDWRLVIASIILTAAGIVIAKLVRTRTEAAL